MLAAAAIAGRFDNSVGAIRFRQVAHLLVA
jgi:hypothetical protein